MRGHREGLYPAPTLAFLLQQVVDNPELSGVDEHDDFPVRLDVPPVSVDVLVDGCTPSEHITLGTAESAMLEVKPHTDLEVNVTGRVEKLPDSLTQVCPDSAKSPLDAFIGDYMQGEDATIYIKCCFKIKGIYISRYICMDTS